LLVDLTDQNSIETLANYVLAKGSPIDGIVVAAGQVGFGSVQDTSAKNAAELMQVNHLGPAHLISKLFPLLTQSSHQPFVISITGVVAEKTFPGMAAYAASKTAHSAWLKALQLEARRAGIRVIDARPGHTETGLATRPLFGTAPNFPPGMNPDHVADLIFRAAIGEFNELPSEAFA
jgi:cyclic-di-GMP-binding biofilm dispersal mediator protein